MKRFSSFITLTALAIASLSFLACEYRTVDPENKPDRPTINNSENFVRPDMSGSPAPNWKNELWIRGEKSWISGCSVGYNYCFDCLGTELYDTDFDLSHEGGHMNIYSYYFDLYFKGRNVIRLGENGTLFAMNKTVRVFCLGDKASVQITAKGDRADAYKNFFYSGDGYSMDVTRMYFPETGDVSIKFTIERKK